MKNERNESIVIVPVRMDGKYSRMLLNIGGSSSINALMEFYREVNVRYSNLMVKYGDNIYNMMHMRAELPNFNTKWITAAYIPEVLDEMTEAVQFSYRYYNHSVCDYIGSFFYVMKNEKHPDSQIAYFSNIPPEGDSLYLLNMDNQMEQSILDQLGYLKNIFDSKEELKIINLNSKK